MVWDWLFKSNYDERVKSVLKLQRSRNYILDNVARIATFCSDEEFYLLLFPVLYWGPFCDAKLAWNLCICVGLGLPIGNILKNIFCIRRPSSPPVWQFNTSNEEHEFALPSTHALLASAVSIHIAIHHITTYQHHEWTLLIGWLLFVIFWTTSISISRVYMGAHTFQDIVLGGMVGSIFGLTLSIVLEVLHDIFVRGSSSVVIISALFCIVLIHCHPIDKTSKINFYLSEGTFDYTSPLVGLTLGGIISRSWYFYVCRQCISTWDSDLLLRYLIGAPISISAYFILRKFLPYVLEPTFRLMRVRAHYIPYSDYAKYITTCIKQFSETIPNGDFNNNEEETRYQNPELLIAWVRIYTKFFMYTALTILVSVGIPVLTGWIIGEK